MTCEVCGDRYVDTMYRWKGRLICRACLTRATIEDERASSESPETIDHEPKSTYSFSIETKESA